MTKPGLRSDAKADKVLAEVINLLMRDGLGPDEVLEWYLKEYVREIFQYYSVTAEKKVRACLNRLTR